MDEKAGHTGELWQGTDFTTMQYILFLVEGTQGVLTVHGLGGAIRSW